MRLDEQAECERLQGVASLSKSEHAGADRYIGAPDDGEPVVYQSITFLPNKGRVFLDLVAHPVALAYAAHVFRGIPFNLVTQTGMILNKGAKQQILHADQQALPFSTPLPVMLNVMTCLSDFEVDMGATRVVPGTHLQASPSLEKDVEEVLSGVGGELRPMTAKAGSAIIWESRTWHCQGASTSDKTRHSVATVYGLHFMKPQDFYPAIIHDDVYETLSEDDKRLLGFDVTYEYAGRIAPRRPDDRRTNTNAHYPYIPELRRDSAARAVRLEDMRIATAAAMPRPVNG